MHFWSMESALSKRLFPLMNETQEFYRDSQFTILGVCMDIGLVEKIREYADYNKLAFPVVYPLNNRLYQRYNGPVPGVSFLIDSKGNIVGQFYGDPGREKLIKIIGLFL